MATTHPVGIRNDIANFVVDKLDAGSTNNEPRVIFRTSVDAEVATFNMDATNAFGDAVNAVCTANAIASDTSTTGGLAAKCVLTDKDNNVIIEGTVGSSGADVIVSDPNYGAGDTAEITSLTYTAPL